MAYPANVSTVTVTGKWAASDGSGTPGSGYVTFTPNAILTDGALGIILEAQPLTATLDAAGAISTSLMATDDTDLSPSGWAYIVTEQITGFPPRTYVLQFPAAQTPVDLSTKAPLVAVPGLVGYVALSAVGAPSGVASLDPTGNVPISQLGNVSGAVVPSGTVVSETGYGQAATAGVANTQSRGDHTHGTPALGTTGTTAAAGNDARITGAVQASTLTAKGDLFIATGASTIVRLPVGSTGQVLTADPAQSAGAKWAPGGMDQAFPLANGYNIKAASGDPNGYFSVGTPGNGTIFCNRVWVPAGVSFDTLCIAIRDAGVHDGATVGNKLGLFDDTGTQLDATAEDPAIFTTKGWRVKALAGGLQAAQTAGRFVYILPLHRGMTTSPNFACLTSANDANTDWWSLAAAGGSSNRRCTYLTGQTALPASFNPASSGTITTFGLLVGVK